MKHFLEQSDILKNLIAKNSEFPLVVILFRLKQECMNEASMKLILKIWAISTIFIHLLESFFNQPSIPNSAFLVGESKVEINAGMIPFLFDIVEECGSHVIIFDLGVIFGHVVQKSNLIRLNFEASLVKFNGSVVGVFKRMTGS
jgi:hypothetical protein